MSLEELQKLPNIGPKLAEQLEQIGATNLAELTEMGSRQAWLKIRAMDSSA